MQRYIQNQIHTYMHTQLAGKQECFMHICQETIEYYSKGILSKSDVIKLMEEFIRFEEILKNPTTRKIIKLAGMLERPEKFALKTPIEILNEIMLVSNQQARQQNKSQIIQ